MLSTEDQENIDVQTVRATKAAIRLAMTDESILASPRERQRWAVALSAHAIAACRRDRSTARFLGGRIRSLEGFCMRASVALFGKQTPTKQGLFARAIRRIAEEQLDTKSTLALLSRVGLVGFTRGLSKPDTSELSLSPLGLIKVNDFLDAFMKTYLRDIATVGLLVKVMASAHGIGKEGRQISTARDYIDQNYDSTSIILRNTDDTSYAWKNWRSVGHLCAAMVDFLQSRADLHFDAAVLSALEEELPTFLANALHYQSFLTGALTIDEVPLSTKVSKNINLRWLPALKFSPLPNSDLPGWGKLIVPRE